MSAFFASGAIVWVVLLLTVAEAAAVVAYRRRTGRGPELSVFLTNLISGGCLMMAVWAALVGAWWGWIGAWLAAAGLAHAVSLRVAWR